MRRAPGYYTYLHLKADTQEVFYVGKGKISRARISSHANRSNYWHNVVAKHGLAVLIAARWADEEDAYLHEKFLIDCFRGMNVPLVNLTDGGDGVRGLKPSDENRQAHSKRMRARFEDAEYLVRHRETQRGRFAEQSARTVLGEKVREAWTPEKRAAAAMRFRDQCASGKHPCRKITEELLIQMTALRVAGAQLKDIAAAFDLSRTHLGNLIRSRIRSAHPSLKVYVAERQEA